MTQPTKKQITHEKILTSAIYLFSIYGYEGTTTRMLSKESGYNISTIFHHFENKEGLYIAAMNHMAQEMNSHLRPTTIKVNKRLEEECSIEEAWELIEEFITLLVMTLSSPTQKNTFFLLIREQTSPPKGGFPLSRVIYDNVEHPIKNLLQRIYPDITHTTLALHARMITGGIISQVEHPVFLRWMLGLPDDADIKPRVWEKVKDLCMIYINTDLNND